jgi:hydroxyacylglutathione hydrolase
MQRGTVLLDVRSGQEFASGHVKGSLNIGLGGQFASWAGTLIPLETPIILLANDEESIEEAVMRLARIGIESVIGYLEGGVIGWSNAGFEIVETPVITVDELRAELDEGEKIFVLDVRRTGEYAGGHVDGAKNIPLAELSKHITEIPRDGQIALICASGYRSSIAKSLLEREGVTNLMNVLGGMKAWNSSNAEATVSTTCSQ